MTHVQTHLHESSRTLGFEFGARGAGDARRGKHRAASFGNRFKDWRVEAGLPNCSAHGLRKVATIRLIEAGCTPHEAAAITGHDSIRVLEIYACEKVPLDRTRPTPWTLSPSNPLKGKGSWKRSGSPNWTRTSDPLINSQLLYQLSYRGIALRARPIAKATGRIYS